MQRSHRIGGSERAPTTGASFRFSESVRLPQHEHLSFRALRAHQPPPPGYSAVSLAQILRADRAAWNMIAEKISTLKRNAQGDLPLELEIQRVLAHPSVSFHLLPLPSKPAPSAPMRPGNKRERESTRSRTLQRTPSAPAPSKGKERFQEQDPAPNVPTKLIGKALQTPGGDRLCRAYSLGKVCPDAKPGEKCPRGLHLCSEPNCQKPHSMQEQK